MLGSLRGLTQSSFARAASEIAKSSAILWLVSVACTSDEAGKADPRPEADASVDATGGSARAEASSDEAAEARAGTGSGATAGADSSTDVDATTGDGPLPDADSPRECRACAQGFKLCDGLCRWSGDPAYGCANVICAACTDYHTAGRAQTSCDAQGQCARACRPGWADCNAEIDGCETPLRSAFVCGACGVTCNSGEVCTEAGCAPACPAPLTSCDGVCEDLTSSPRACGRCNRVCPSPAGMIPVCENGECAARDPVCPTGQELCQKTCVPLGTCPACQPGCKENSSSCEGGCCVCKPGWSVARTGTACDPEACVDTRRDARACGDAQQRCDGWCDNGTCRPVASMDWLSGLSRPLSLKLANRSIYFVDDEGVKVVSTQTRAVTILARLSGARDLAIDASHAFIGTPDGVMRLSLSGGVPELMWPGGPVEQVDVASERVFWVTEGPPLYAFWMAPKAGGTGESLPVWRNPSCAAVVTSFAANDRFVVASVYAYAAGSDCELDEGGFTRLRLSDRTVTRLLTPGGGGEALALAGDDAYILNSKSGCLAATWVRGSDVAGTTLFCDPPSMIGVSYALVFNAVVFDDANVYFGFTRVPRCGGSPTYLSTLNPRYHHDGFVGWIRDAVSTAVDEAYLYFTTESGIGRVPK
jgi:hypothetical protein